MFKIAYLGKLILNLDLAQSQNLINCFLSQGLPILKILRTFIHNFLSTSNPVHWRTDALTTGDRIYLPNFVGNATVEWYLHWCCRAVPYQVTSGRCRICKSSVHQPGSHYCQGCAYKKGLCNLSKVSHLPTFVCYCCFTAVAEQTKVTVSRSIHWVNPAVNPVVLNAYCR